MALHAELNQLPDNIEGVTQVMFQAQIPTLANDCTFSRQYDIMKDICQHLIDEDLGSGAMCLVQKAILGNFGANRRSCDLI